LKVSQGCFHNIVERNEARIIVTDKEGIVCFVNQSAEELFNCKAKELVGTLFGFSITKNKKMEIDLIRKGGGKNIGEMQTTETEWYGEFANLIMINDITERKQVEEKQKVLLKKKEDLVLELQKALENVKKLSGFIPICSHCKKNRDDKGYWKGVEQFISEHSEVDFSHAICPECMEKLYPKQYEIMKKKGLYKKNKIMIG